MSFKKRELKICVSSSGEDLSSQIDPRFGRCEFFILVDVAEGEIKKVSAIENKNILQSSGAGIAGASNLGDLGVDILVTGNVGPKAEDVLTQLGIQIIKTSGIVNDAVKKVISGKINSKDVLISEEEKSLENNNQNKESKDTKKMLVPLLEDKGLSSRVALHFGHAPFFGLYNLKSKEIIVQENNLDHSSSEKTPVDQIVEGFNPSIVFVQDIGSRAMRLFSQRGIVLKTGAFKILKEVVENFDKLEELKESCGH